MCARPAPVAHPRPALGVVTLPTEPCNPPVNRAPYRSDENALDADRGNPRSSDLRAPAKRESGTKTDTTRTSFSPSGALRNTTKVVTTFKGPNRLTARTHVQYAKDGSPKSMTDERRTNGEARSKTISTRASGARHVSEMNPTHSTYDKVRYTYYPNSSTIRSKTTRVGNEVMQTHYRRDGQPVSTTVTVNGVTTDKVRHPAEPAQ